MKKMILMAPAIAAVLIAGCGADPQTSADTAPPAAAAAVPAVDVVPAPYAMAADAPTSGYCALDSANGQRGEVVTLPGSDVAVFGGWAADAEKQVPEGALFVFGNGADSHAVPLVAGANRPDVAAALGSEALAQAGFNLRLDLAGIPAGSYDLSVVTDPATSAHCDLRTRLVIE
ncbi:hypothetical protein WCE37_11500 [Luteimonas sp. MJ250]|uniref:hypothetical protein n=1 Tax=Luteimonas sp. MJ250 TaxID=3129236 RepID=UPI0031BB29E1